MTSSLPRQRQKLGFTQQQMAVLLKTDQSEISKAENGELPSGSEAA